MTCSGPSIKNVRFSWVGGPLKVYAPKNDHIQSAQLWMGVPKSPIWGVRSLSMAPNKINDIKKKKLHTESALFL